MMIMPTRPYNRLFCSPIWSMDAISLFTGQHRELQLSMPWVWIKHLCVIGLKCVCVRLCHY